MGGGVYENAGMRVRFFISIRDTTETTKEPPFFESRDMTRRQTTTQINCIKILWVR